MAERSTAIGRFEKSTGVTSSLAGTASSSGTAVTGTTTAFDTALRTGDAIRDEAGTEFRTVTAIASATALTLDSAFTTALSGATLVAATFTEIPQVTSLTGLSGERSESEVSSWSSGDDRKFILGRRDPGTAELPFWLDAKLAAHTGLKTDQDNSTERVWRAYIFDSEAATALPDDSNSVITFRGRVKAFPIDFPEDGALGGTLTIRVSGPVTIAAGVDP
jgi:hypothetical protein